MKMQAAVIWEAQSDWSVEQVELDPPKRGEVMVEIVAAGLCHSDEHFLTGDMTLPDEMLDQLGIAMFPAIGGHEGSGRVVEVGEGVTDLVPGDHVVFSFVPHAGTARAARRDTRTSATWAPYSSPVARSATSRLVITRVDRTSPSCVASAPSPSTPSSPHSAA